MIYRGIVFLMIFAFSSVSAQVEMLPCQDENDGVIGLDRKNWNNGSTTSHSEGTLHNYVLPDNTFGDCKFISEVEVEITIFNIDDSNLTCSPPSAYFVNIYQNCPSTAPASCDPTTTLIYENPNIPIINSQVLSFFSPPEDFDFNDDFSIDIVPVMDVNCPNGQSAISSNEIILDFEICVTVTISDMTIATPPELGAPLSVCPGTTTTLDPGNYDMYLWSPTGETTPTIDVGSGVYEVTVTDANGCTGTDDIVVSSFPLPTISFAPASPAVCDNGSVNVSVNETFSSYAWSNSMTTQSVSLTTGTYNVTVTDNNNCTAEASVTVSSVSPPNAGINNFITVCNDGTTYNMETALGTFDPGGTWSDDNLSNIDVNASPSMVSFDGLAAGTYDYTYTASGTAPCPDDMATITVQVVQRNFAGIDASEQFCLDPGPLDFVSLLGNPDAGGMWTDLSGNGTDLSNPFAVNLDGFPSGIYTYMYEIADNGICAAASSTLTIEILTVVTAGDDNMTTVCEGTQFDLNALLSATASTTGTFFDSGGSGGLTGSIVNTTGLAGQTFIFTYEVGTAGSTCGVDIAELTLIIASGVSAGQGQTDSICAGDILDLFDFIINEDIGGSFSALTNANGLANNMLNTNNLLAGTYQYQYLVGDGTSCQPDTTMITLTLIGRPTVSLSPDGLMICEGQCEDILVDLTGLPPFTFPVLIYAPDGTTLLASDTITTSDPSYSLSACNTGQTAVIDNDSLLLPNESEYILTIPNLTDSLCSVMFGTASDSITIMTNSATLVEIDTVACITDTLDINGNILVDGNAIAIDTFVGARCDSIVIINVTFQNADTIYLTPTICDGDSLMIGGVFYSQAMSSDEITTINPNGCDSVTVIQVSFFPPSDSLLMLPLCTGDSITISGNVYNVNNPTDTLVLTGAGSTGCDSTIYIDLEFSSDITLLINPTLCPGQAITVNSIIYDMQNNSGTDTLVGIGCDTIVTIDLSFFQVDEGDLSGTFCQDFSTEVNGTIYDIANPIGSEMLLGQSFNGCDSTVNINLDFEDPIIVPFIMDLCQGDSIVINGTTYNSAVIAAPEIFSGITAAGCDSTVEVTINILPSYIEPTTETLCQGDSIFLAGFWQFGDGTFNDTLASVDLCDSIISTSVTFISCATSIGITQEDNACAGDSVGTIFIDISTDLVLPLSLSVTSVDTGEEEIIDISTPQTNIQIPNLLSGAYIVALTDADGTLIETETVTIADLGPPMSGQWNVVNLIPCPGDLGTLEYIAMGGTAMYTYDWDDDSLDGSAIATDVSSGTYGLTVTDQNGCEINDTFILDEPSPISYIVAAIDPTCSEASDGQITITDISGGAEPYTITINGAVVNNGDMDSLVNGNYDIEITDANSCTVPFTEVLASTNEISLGTYEQEYIIEQGDSVQIIGSDLATDLSFTWGDSISLSCTDCASPVAIPATTTTYSLLITNEEGCSQALAVTVVVVEKENELVFPNIFSPNGDFVNDELIFNIGADRPVQLSIYDRWGSLIYQTQSLSGTVSWDGMRNGSLVSNGVYMYSLQTIDAQESTINIVGDVLLSR